MAFSFPYYYYYYYYYKKNSHNNMKINFIFQVINKAERIREKVSDSILSFHFHYLHE